METEIKILETDLGFRLEFGLEDCNCAIGSKNPGKVYGYSPCPKCHGTNRTKGGKGKGQCNYCFQGRVVDTNKLETCPNCNGTGTEPATPYSHLTKTITEQLLDVIPLRVRRSEAKQTFNEAYLGYGFVYSTTDYGAYKSLTDEELVAKVRKSLIEGHHQAINFCDKQGNLCAELVILCNNVGYSVKAVKSEANTVAA